MHYHFPSKNKWLLGGSIGVLLISSISCYCLFKLHQQHTLLTSTPTNPFKNASTPSTSQKESETQRQHNPIILSNESMQSIQTKPGIKTNKASNLVSYKTRSTSVPKPAAIERHTGIPILELHSIANDPSDPYCISPQNFDAEMKHLKDSGYHPITFSDLDNAWFHHGVLPSKPIMLTFDDGYEDNYTAAYPILKKYHLKATIFMVSGFENKPNFLKWNQMNAMESSGLVEIQSHTVNHHNLAKIPLAQAKKEIFDSKAQLQSHLPDPILAFCYPNGGFNAQIVKLVQQAGYIFATTGEHGYASLVQGQYTLDRDLISGFETPKTFAAQFS